MRDLLVYTADADALATVRAVLNRPRELNIRVLDFLVERYPMRDPGIVKEGPELARRFKGQFNKVVLLWDHHGSGWDHKYSPAAAARRIQERLDSGSWKDASSAIVLVPELEEWIWHDREALCRYLAISASDLDEWIGDYAGRAGRTADQLVMERPKDIFEFVCLEKIRRTISPRDFERIGAVASLVHWQTSDSFRSFCEVLQEWFPPHGDQLGGSGAGL